jgi:UDP-GlcNAc:undecaprenyl-phosphate/decaprenyl-phosphate GlcNAc-1-phosphate transferase
VDLTFEKIIDQPAIQIFLSMVLSLGITWRAIPVIRQICQLRGLMENPVKRSSHRSPTPTFGGVAIFGGTLIGYMIWNFGDEEFLIHKALAGFVILFFLGLKDDIFALVPLKKIASQIIASGLVVISGDLRVTSFFGILGVHDISYVVSVIFTIFLFVALINSFNLIDGIDGLSGGIGMIASSGFGLWFFLNEHWSLACLSLSLAASLLGFLRYNYSKNQKIFMGDTGSLIVGYLVTIFAVKFVSLSQSVNFSPGDNMVSAPILAIVILSVPIFDTLRVFSVRILKGKSPFSADRNHIHHLLVDNGLSHLVASCVLYTITIGLTVFTYFMRYFFSNTALSVYVLSIFGIYLAIGKWLEIRRFRNYKSKLMNGETLNPLNSEIELANSINQN